MINSSGFKMSILSLAAIALTSPKAFAQPQRTLVLRSLERESETHLKIRASALESDQTGVFPISTMDKGSFTVSFDSEKLTAPTLGLSTFDNSRRSHHRAIVWAYDATGVKTMKGLNKELRALTAQEFIGFNADFISILGVAPSKTIERVLLDNSNQENILALQRQLLADPIGVPPHAVFQDSAVCVAASKFEKWALAGLTKSDQKLLVLLGGALQVGESQKKINESCIQKLLNAGVAIHQIIFAKPATFMTRHWTTLSAAATQGAVYRVVDLQGASRALQATKNILDKEYVISAQIPEQILTKSDNESTSLKLLANYHGSIFQSVEQSVRLQTATIPKNQKEPSPKSAVAVLSPPRLSVVEDTKGLSLNAWLEWLSTAVLVGMIVTIRHLKRMESGIFPVTAQDEDSDVTDGPLLLVLSGPERGREFRIRQKSIVLGRGLLSDLRLRSSRIKRKHGRLRFEGDKAIIEDFSNGGIAINGRPLRHLRVIGHGSVIQLGDVHLLFRCGET
jgi:hypothetical protein